MIGKKTGKEADQIMGKNGNRKTFGIILIMLIQLVGILIFGRRIWDGYRDTLINNQKEQMMITSQILGKTLSAMLTDYRDDLELIVKMAQEGRVDEQFYREYLETQEHFEVDLSWKDENGQLEKSMKGIPLEKPVLLTQMDQNYSIWQYENQEKEKYLVFQRQMEGGGVCSLVVDGEAFYQNLISDIHIGTNGYVVVKNQDGRIIMHPDREQWGINIIEGRKKMYPELDFSSLEDLVEAQNSGKSGISEYYSYWWTKEDIPKVKKVSAYVPAAAGDSFWTVSVVIDYEDLSAPMADGFRSLALIFGLSSVYFILMAGYITKLLMDSRKAASEIAYLKELNQVLEEMHRSEETIAHQQRLQIMGTMTGCIVHEFNNFLTPIMGHAELLMMELPETSDAYDSAKEIYEASEKAKDVIRQISFMSRKNVETVYKRIESEKFLKRAARMVESICPPNVELTTDFDRGKLCFPGNATQLNQVLLNICINGIYAIGHGEGRLRLKSSSVSRKELQRYIDAEPEGVWENYLQIDIQDNGCGMDEKTLKQIFEPFFTTKKNGEGTGLGLALAEQIISSHKGYICAESKLGTGTAFHVFLPIIEADERIIPKTGEKKVRIVLIGSNAKVLHMLKKNLKKKQTEIVICKNREELEAFFKEPGTDVLLIDENLEDGTGIDFCMALMGKYEEMIRILMVNKVTREAVEAKQRGIIHAYIEKPVSDETIFETIYQCCHGIRE